MVFLCHFGNFPNETFYEQVYKYRCPNLLLVHPNANYWNKVWYIWHPTIYVMNIVMDDWSLDEISFSKWQYLQRCKPKMPRMLHKGMTNNIRFTNSVGDTTRTIDN